MAAGYFRARIKGLSPFDKVLFNLHSDFGMLRENLRLLEAWPGAFKTAL